MRALYIHSDYLEFTVKKKTPVAEDITDAEKQGRFEEVLVAFLSVEKADEEEFDAVAAEAVRDISDVAGKVKSQHIVLYPYAHLSSSLSSPDTGKRMLRTLESMLKEKGFEVHRAPFGWYKAFKISCKRPPPLRAVPRHQGGGEEGRG